MLFLVLLALLTCARNVDYHAPLSRRNEENEMRTHRSVRVYRMRVLGFDPGIKNLGVCYINHGTVEMLDVVDVTDFLCGIRRLDAWFHQLDDTDVIAIEAQPGTNRQVTKVMHFVELYARIHTRARIVFIAPRTRLAFVKQTVSESGPTLSQTYKERKLASIRVARDLITRHSPGMLETFDGFVKKDDAAEAFLCAWLAHKKYNVAP